jgi:hypothetical protein
MKHDFTRHADGGLAAGALLPRHQVRMPPDRMERTMTCLDDDAIAAFAEGSLNAAERHAVVAHVAGCARCTAILGSVARATADPAVRREIARTTTSSRRWLLTALPVAAAAALVLWIMPRADTANDDRHRAPVIPSATPVPVPVEPAGMVAQALAFRWRAVTGVRQYRLTLFDERGSVLFESQTADTTVVIPREVTLTPGRAYLWKVEARIGFDRSVASELQDFTIATRPVR